MARKRMFFTSTRAERELGYRFRPVEEALAEALPYFNPGCFTALSFL